MPELESVSVPKAGKSVKKGAEAASSAAASATEAAGGAANAAAANATTAGAKGLGGLVDKVVGAVAKPFQAVASVAKSAISSVSNAISGLFGAGAKAVATVAVTTTTAVATVGVGGAMTSTTDDGAAAVMNEIIQYDEDCLAAMDMVGGDSAGGDTSLTSPQVMQNASIIYNTFLTYGLSIGLDQTAAEDHALGIVCNMQHESSCYPSMVQGHWASPYYGMNVMPTTYTDHGGGVGLVQWTPMAAKEALENNRGSHNWYDLDYQLSFILSSKDVNWGTTTKYFERSFADGAEATRWFLKYWERCGGSTTASDHLDSGKAGTYYNKRWVSAPTDVTKMKLTVAQYALSSDDQGLIDNILANAEEITTTATINAVASTACSYGAYDNSSIAAAAISYSWPRKDQSFNNGTALYQQVYNAILSDRVYYKSCDRNVIAAVCWSGSDDNFASKGGVDAQWAYLNGAGTSIWQKIGTFGSGVTLADCEPGDILIITASQRGTAHGHVMIYVGNEMITQVHGSAAPAGANIIAASYMDYSPCAQAWTDASLSGYTVFRCYNPMDSDRYAGAGGNFVAAPESEQE